MATAKNTLSLRVSNRIILAHDGSGRRHWMHVVQDPAGMISLVDGEVLRVLTPEAASALVMELVSALGATLEI